MGDMDVIHGEGTRTSATARQLPVVTGAQKSLWSFQDVESPLIRRHTDRNMSDIRAEFVK